MMKAKQLCSLGLSAVLAVSVLAGCSANSSSGSGSAASDTSGKKVTLTVMTSGTASTDGKNFDTDLFPKYVNEAFPNVTVQATELPDDQYYTSLKTKLAAGSAPDLFLVQPKSAGDNAVTTMAKSGYLAPLDNFQYWNKMPAAIKDDMSYNGKPYALSSGVGFLGVFYNKQMFQDAGITSVPANWDDFLKDCDALKSKGHQPIAMGDKDSYVIQFGLYQVAANVVYPDNPKFDTDLASGKTKFTDQPWTDALTMYKTLYDKGYVESGSLGVGATQAQQMFIDGQAAMTFDGNFNAGALQAQGSATFDRGFFPLPANKAGSTTYAAAATSAGYGIYAKSSHIDLCKQILNTMADGKSDLFKAWSTNERTLSPYEGVTNPNPIFSDVLKVYQEGHSYYWANQAWPAGVDSELEADFSLIIGKQNTTVNQVASKMQAKYKDLSSD